MKGTGPERNLGADPVKGRQFFTKSTDAGCVDHPLTGALARVLLSCCRRDTNVRGSPGPPSGQSTPPPAPNPGQHQVPSVSVEPPA